MKVNIYYGGRGLIGDPTLYVINKMASVLEELNVTVERYDLYESKNSITTLPNTLKDADGIILASTVEWYGIGGYMQSFLDACWLYADKEKLAQIAAEKKWSISFVVEQIVQQWLEEHTKDDL